MQYNWWRWSRLQLITSTEEYDGSWTAGGDLGTGCIAKEWAISLELKQLVYGCNRWHYPPSPVTNIT